jgi:anti-sigma regulatory factor (Ser/Thr protein kinase)/putative methionine-R-sulfoxide reductase with GAF domain
MTAVSGSGHEWVTGRAPGAGQVVLRPALPLAGPSEQLRGLYTLSDPLLSELELNELLDEILVRVRDVLDVDTVAILLLDEEANQLVARAAKGIEEEVEQGVRIPIGRGFAGRIAADRVAIFVADVDHADILNPILREKGICSLVGVPLIVEGKLIGVMHVGSLHPRQFDETDVGVLQLASARIAPAIERAQLTAELEHERHVAMLLQRSLLPRRIVDVPGITVAARYLPARDEVGGDWYDVIELPGGVIGIAIGDVVGHGVRAAALMGQLRTALRAYAQEGHGPGRTLELVDRFVQDMEDAPMATAAYAVLDANLGIVRFATAGHLPPIVIGGGEPRVVEVPPAVPLGAFPYRTYREHEFTLAGGETIVLYTDGLVERRGTSVADGIELLCRVLSEASNPEEACLLAMDRMVPLEGSPDDVAIVALQNSVIPQELALQLPAEPYVLARVRRIIRRWLTARGADRVALDEMTIAVSDACANAIEHAYGPGRGSFELSARLEGDDVVLVVRDFGAWRASRGEHRGRGLDVMRAAMDEVEVRTDSSGTEVVLRRQIGSPR